jgi:hypothetical protein
MPSASLDRARRDIGAVADRLATSYQESDGWGATAITLRDELMPNEVRLMVTTMMGAVSLVLLIACANVANLLLARATARQREIAVRTALGAGRGRIVRQLLTESVLIALASAPFGVALAWVGLRWLTSSVPPEGQVPYYVNWDMNWRVVIYTVLTSAVTGLVFGLAPALNAADADLHRSLKDGGRGRRWQRIQESPSQRPGRRRDRLVAHAPGWRLALRTELPQPAACRWRSRHAAAHDHAIFAGGRRVSIR